MFLQKLLKNVIEVVFDNSSLFYLGFKESLFVNLEFISDFLLFVFIVFSQKLSDYVLNEDIEFMGLFFVMDNDF